MAILELEPITGVWGQSSQWGPGAEMASKQSIGGEHGDHYSIREMQLNTACIALS